MDVVCVNSFDGPAEWVVVSIPAGCVVQSDDGVDYLLGRDPTTGKKCFVCLASGTVHQWEMMCRRTLFRQLPNAKMVRGPDA